MISDIMESIMENEALLELISSREADEMYPLFEEKVLPAIIKIKSPEATEKAILKTSVEIFKNIATLTTENKYKNLERIFDAITKIQ